MDGPGRKGRSVSHRIQVEPERSQTATQGVINPARGALWLKLILNPVSSKPVFIASHIPPAPHSDISPPPPNALHQSPSSPVGHGHEITAAVPPQPGREDPLSAVLWQATTTTTAATAVSSSRLSPYIRALVFGCVCRHTPALVLLIMHVSRVFRYSRAQPRPGSRWQPHVKGCRTAARVMFCDGARTFVLCAHGSTTPMHLEGCPHKMNAVCPSF